MVENISRVLRKITRKYKKWCVLKILKSYNNFYSKKGSLSEEIPDNFPRIVGDNSVLFDNSDGSLPKGKLSSIPAAIQNKVNYFDPWNQRPEPSNHPVLPVLAELKYSHMPTVSQNNFHALALFPSVSFWNPYDREISFSNLYI